MKACNRGHCNARPNRGAMPLHVRSFADSMRHVNTLADMRDFLRFNPEGRLILGRFPVEHMLAFVLADRPRNRALWEGVC